MKIFSFRRMFTFGAGAAVGYFLGSREGRKQAEALARQAQEFWTDPKTQQQVHNVTEQVSDVVKDKAPALGDVADKAAGLVDKSTGYNSDDASTAAKADTISDPETDPSNEGPNA